jgi:hypothetical protein
MDGIHPNHGSGAFNSKIDLLHDVLGFAKNPKQTGEGNNRH